MLPRDHYPNTMTVFKVYCMNIPTLSIAVLLSLRSTEC